MDTHWRPIAEAEKDGREIWAFNGEQVRMKWSEGKHGEDTWGLWIYADELLVDVDPSPEQPRYFMELPPDPVETEQFAPATSSDDETMN